MLLEKNQDYERWEKLSQIEETWEINGVWNLELNPRSGKKKKQLKGHNLKNKSSEIWVSYYIESRLIS